MLSESERNELKEKFSKVFDLIIKRFLGRPFAEVFTSYVRFRSGRKSIPECMLEDPQGFFNIAVSFFGSEEALESFIKVAIRYVVDNHGEADVISSSLLSSLKRNDKQSLLDTIRELCRKALVC